MSYLCFWVQTEFEAGMEKIWRDDMLGGMVGVAPTAQRWSGEMIDSGKGWVQPPEDLIKNNRFVEMWCSVNVKFMSLPAHPSRKPAASGNTGTWTHARRTDIGTASASRGEDWRRHYDWAAICDLLCAASSAHPNRSKWYWQANKFSAWNHVSPTRLHSPPSPYTSMTHWSAK